ncbi:MAG: hypothetical protein KGZ87_04540 [Bacteroidetes bacterium]|nr:hypothetical protein [Bacteroidota bacterium]
MKYSLLLFFIVSYSQTPEIITLPEFYCGKGVIFDKSDHIPLDGYYYLKQFTPSIEQIKRSEKIMYQDYYTFYVRLFEKNGQNISSINKKYKLPKKVKNKFKKYYRQYAGYINKDRDTIVFIRLMNFSNQKQANKHFRSWDKFIDFGFGDWYEKNQTYRSINLNQNKIDY